ncbi:MAG: hypothetical protein ACOCVQ_02070, partial [Bacillota bacterium]
HLPERDRAFGNADWAATRRDLEYILDSLIAQIGLYGESLLREYLARSSGLLRPLGLEKEHALEGSSALSPLAPRDQTGVAAQELDCSIPMGVRYVR